VERPLLSHEADQAISEKVVFAEDIELIKARLERLPTRLDVARIAVLVILGAAGLTSLLVSIVFR
jgi:hypothetical protein